MIAVTMKGGSKVHVAESEILSISECTYRTPTTIRSKDGKILEVEDSAASLMKSMKTKDDTPTLKIYREGDQWGVLFGENIQEGVYGSGPTVIEALQDFDAAWGKEKGLACPSPLTYDSDRMKYLEAMSWLPWLAEAAYHQMLVHDCDIDGWESMQRAATQAYLWMKKHKWDTSRIDAILTEHDRLPDFKLIRQ